MLPLPLAATVSRSGGHSDRHDTQLFHPRRTDETWGKNARWNFCRHRGAWVHRAGAWRRCLAHPRWRQHVVASRRSHLRCHQADRDRARGKVEIDYGVGRILLADSVSYDQKTDIVTADGHVSLTAQNGDVAFANHVVLNDKMRDGALEGFAALIGKNGRMVAVSAKRSAGRFTEALRAAYTPCKICAKKGDRTPLWQVKSYRVIYDQVTHKIKFQDATIEFLGVPILYTPYAFAA